jgi:hypothetical protein
VVQHLGGTEDVVCDVTGEVDERLARTLSARPDRERLLLMIKTTNPTVLASVARLSWARRVFIVADAAAQPADLRTLAPLVELRELRVTNVTVRSVADAWAFHRLESLHAFEEGSADLRGVEALPNLSRLAVGHAVADSSPLAEAGSLRSLQILGEQDNIAPLAALSALDALSITVTPRTKLDPIRRITSLRELTITGADPHELAKVLAPLPKLTRLFVSGENVIDARPFAQLARLELLDLGRTRVTAIAPLAALPKLKTLKLFEAPVKDLPSLTAFPALEHVSLPRETPDALRAELQGKMPRVRF